MDTLPPEIWEMICDALYLDTESKCAFRSTCRRFAEIGARTCFKYIHLMYLSKSFENLLAISRHPVYSRCVERIFCEAPSLKPMEREEWEDEISVPMKPLGSELASMLIPLPPGPDATERDVRHYMRDIQRLRELGRARSHFTRRQLDQGYEQYELMCDDAEEIEEFDHDYYTINDAFSRLPNLKEIYLSTTQYFRVSNSLSNAFKHMLVLPDKDHEYHGDAGERHLQALLRGAALPNIKLETLVTDLTGWGVFSYDGYSLLYPSEFRPAFRWLKKINLCLGADFDAADDFELAELRQQELGECLRTSENLEYLSLELGDLYKAVEQRAYLPTVNGDLVLLQSTTWKHLHTLHLSIVDVTEESLVDFFQRHSATLKEIKLTGIWLTKGEWATAFRRLKDPFSKAKVLDFMGAFGSGEINIDDIILPMSPHVLLWTPDEDLHKPHLSDHLIAYYLHDGPFPLRTIAELEATLPEDERGLLIDGLDLITMPVPRVSEAHGLLEW